MPRANRLTGPKQNSATSAHQVFLWDGAALDDWFAGQPAACPSCGERLDPTKPEAMIGHVSLHDHPPAVRAKLERALYALRNWENLPEVRAEVLGQTILRLRGDPAKFDELQRLGIVSRVAGKG